jgi:hypothetical protein
MAGAGTAKAEAIRSDGTPRTTWSIRGVRTAGSIAGWAQTKSRASLRSGIASTSTSSQCGPFPSALSHPYRPRGPEAPPGTAAGASGANPASGWSGTVVRNAAER